jgi:hypothetical protein
MSRRAWTILLVGGGIVLAVLIGIWAVQKDEETKPEAISALCGSLTELEGSVQALLSLDPGTASQDEYQSDVSAIEDDWDQVKSDAQDVQDASTGDLDSAWDDFKSTLDDIPSDSSVSDALSDVSQSAQALVSAAQSTASEIDCSTSSS